MEHLVISPQPIAKCDELTQHLATEENPFHFTDCGLDNVFLVGIKYFTSNDGRIVAEIPALNQLMRLIARDLVFSQTSLRGEEIRFLRKRLGMKTSDYSKVLRVDVATLSRIENEKQPPSNQLDSLIRMSYLLLCNDPILAKHVEKLKELITAEIHRGQFKIVMKVSPENEWSDLPLAA
jgi:DNA-binding transcriptional regulator YiaG